MTRDDRLIEPLLANDEVKMWFDRLLARAERRDLSGIHGSYDHIYENVIGKCFILGLNANIPRFHEAMGFVLDFLEVQIAKTHSPKLTFDKMYQYRDNETLLVCYLPFLRYANEPAVRYVAEKRINLVYELRNSGAMTSTPVTEGSRALIRHGSPTLSTRSYTRMATSGSLQSMTSFSMPGSILIWMKRCGEKWR